MDEAVTKETLEGLELIAEVSDAGALEKIIVGTLAVLCRRTTAAAVQPHLGKGSCVKSSLSRHSAAQTSQDPTPPFA